MSSIFTALVEQTPDQSDLTDKTKRHSKLNLKVLNISGNHLCQFDIIADDLGLNQTMTRLHLGNTGISDKDIPSIVAIVTGNHCLKELNLRENKLSSACLSALWNALLGKFCFGDSLCFPYVSLSYIYLMIRK